MIIQADNGGQPCAENFCLHSSPNPSEKSTASYSLSRKQRQKNKRKARRANERSFSNDSREIPLPEIPKEKWDFIVSIAGEKQARKSARFVAMRRENFLDENPGIRLATTLEGGFMIVDRDLLNEPEKKALADFVEKVAA